MDRTNYILLTLFITFLQLMRNIWGHAIITGHCEKNITVKYQVPVTKSRPVKNADNTSGSQVYIDYEQRQRWDVVYVCCPGYRTIIFGLCEAMCDENCPPHSHCAEPNKCQCSRGYEPSHHTNKQNKLICRPICNNGGCPEHSHCVAPNVCECRAGYRDVNAWYHTLRCERVPCGPEHRYDVTRRSCVHTEMNVEKLIQKVALRFSNGLLTDSDAKKDAQRLQEEIEIEDSSSTF